jgi:hypothetical protein
VALALAVFRLDLHCGIGAGRMADVRAVKAGLRSITLHENGDSSIGCAVHSVPWPSITPFTSLP